MEVKYLPPKARTLFFIRNFAGVVFSSIWIYIYLVLDSLAEDYSIAGGIVVLLIFLIFIAPVVLLWSHLTYKAYSYEFTDHSIRKQYGVIRKKDISIPFEKIQNIDIHRGIFDRLLGLSTLRIQTAGASFSIGRKGRRYSSEGTIPGLTQTEAVKISEYLIRKVKESSGIGI